MRGKLIARRITIELPAEVWRCFDLYLETFPKMKAAHLVSSLLLMMLLALREVILKKSEALRVSCLQEVVDRLSSEDVAKLDHLLHRDAPLPSVPPFRKPDPAVLVLPGGGCAAPALGSQDGGGAGGGQEGDGQKETAP
jgi:hypothetical protein